MKIISRVPTQEYRDGWDLVFGKKEKKEPISVEIDTNEIPNENPTEPCIKDE
jgi:hypothetical protein